MESHIDKERWSIDSDAGFREQLRQARLTLLEPNHDPADLQERLQAIDTVLIARQANRKAELLQRKAELDAESAQGEGKPQSIDV